MAPPFSRAEQLRNLFQTKNHDTGFKLLISNEQSFAGADSTVTEEAGIEPRSVVCDFGISIQTL